MRKWVPNLEFTCGAHFFDPMTFIFVRYAKINTSLSSIMPLVFSQKPEWCKINYDSRFRLIIDHRKTVTYPFSHLWYMITLLASSPVANFHIFFFPFVSLTRVILEADDHIFFPILWSLIYSMDSFFLPFFLSCFWSFNPIVCYIYHRISSSREEKMIWYGFREIDGSLVAIEVDITVVRGSWKWESGWRSVLGGRSSSSDDIN